MVILAFLPFICFGGIFFFVLNHDKEHNEPFFMSVIKAALIWCTLIWCETNILSMLNAIAGHIIMTFWGMASSVSVWLAVKCWQKPVLALPKGPLAFTLYLLCVITLAIGLIYPSNNWDVSSYHLPRIMQWLQNHSLEPFYTRIPRQIGMPPFNSMIALQTMAAGTDIFSALPQWLAFAGSIIGISHIVIQIGGTRRAALLGALFFATLPAALMGASSAESIDLVTFWLLSFISLTLAWLKRAAWPTALFLGLCLGFAILSKGSAYIVAFPFVLVIAVFCLKNYRSRFLQGCLIAMLVIAINLPHFTRVYTAYGSIVGGAEANIAKRPSPALFLTNSLYNLLANEPWFLRLVGKENIQGFARNVLRQDDTDKENFPWGGITRAADYFNFFEGYGHNPWHALFIAILLTGVIFRKFRPPLLFSCCVGGAFCLYSLLLSWHPWTARVQTSIFAVAAPICGLFLDGIRFKYRLALLVPLYVSLILPMQMWERPFLPFARQKAHFLSNPREELYISEKSHSFPERYVQAARFLASQNPRKVGLYEDDNALEYPLWAILSRNMAKMPTITHIDLAEPQGPDSPEYVWVQGDSPDGKSLQVKVLKREDGQYKQIFPLPAKQEIDAKKPS